MTFNQPQFHWIGINANGNKISGKLFSTNKNTAVKKLIADNITMLSIKKTNPFYSLAHNKKFTPKHRLDFTQQLLLLIQAGIPLVDALSLIANTSSQNTYQNIIITIKEKIIKGENFSAALSYFSGYFDKTFCKMIAVGEQSGQLESVLIQLIENQENRIQMQSKINKALFYPISVCCIAIAITIGLLIFVIPQFRAIYENFGAELPAMTRHLISISHALTENGIVYLILTILFIFTIKLFLIKNHHLKNTLQFIIFKIPFVQSVMITQQIARWSQLLAMTLSSGIPLIDALQITNQAISQPLLQRQLQKVRDSVITGKSLHNALDHCCFFPERAKTMIAIGENADALSIMMKRVAIFYQHKLNETLDGLSKLLEPVIMITVASFVSGLIIAMYLPIFRMGSVI